MRESTMGKTSNVTRRQAVALGGAALLCVPLALRTGLAGAEESAPLTTELDGVRFEAQVSGLGSSRLTIDFTVEAVERGSAVTQVRVAMRPTDIYGFYLDEVNIDLDFSGEPLAEGEPRSASVEVEAEEDVASVEIVGFLAQRAQPLWSGRGVAVYLLGEERVGRTNRLSLFLEGSGTLESLVFETSVYDATGAEVGAPKAVVVDPEGEPLVLNGSAALSVDLPWREGAAGWSVVSGEVRKERKQVATFETVEFGSYPATSAGDPAPIEWLVLAEEDGRRLLLAKSVLDAVPYNDALEDVTWATCTLRTWLNGEFLQVAFTEEEQARIAPTVLTNDDNPDYGTPGGEVTEDRVFCLSLAEVCRFFGVVTRTEFVDEYGPLGCEEAYDLMPGYEALVACATDYAVERGTYVSGVNGGSRWWLRSPGNAAGYAANVVVDGYVSSFGYYVDDSSYGVRPALWLNL